MTTRARLRAATVATLLLAGAALRAETSPVIRSEGEATLRALEAALLLSGQEGGVIRTAVVTVAAPLDDGQTGVHLLLEVEGAPLRPEAESEGRLDLFVYALEPASGEVVASTSRRLRLLPVHGPLLEGGGVKAAIELPLPPGDFDLRILARTGAGEFGIRSAPVTVPGEGGGPALVAPPLWSQTRGGWLLAVGGRPPRPHPFVAAEAPLPAALPVVGAGATLEGALLGRELPQGEPDLVAQLRHNATGLLAEVRATPLGRERAGAGGVEALPFRLPVAGLGPGLYTVRLVAQIGDTRLTSPSAVLALSAAADESRPWPAVDLDADASGGLQSAEAPPPESLPPGGLEAGEALDGVVGLLATGDRDAARRRLAELHGQAGTAGVSLTRLRDAEWQRIESAGRSGWERLASLLSLYAELAGEYRARRRIGLAEHAELLTTRFAHAYSRQLQTDEARWTAAAMLESVAAAAMMGGVPGRAAAAYRDALDIQAARPVALLGLGAVLEKMGRPAEAAGPLERLLEIEPGHPEARLRLAVNLARTGDAGRAERMLDALLEEPAVPEWIARLAAQELARQALAARRPERAEERLREARERWPEDPSLAILLAWTLDARGRRAEADPLLQAVDRRPPGDTPLPRYRYNAWPLEAVAVDATAALPDAGPPPGGR